MKRILVITNNLQQASYRLRVAALIRRLADKGFDLDVRVRPKSWLKRRGLLRQAGGYHAVLLQRKLLDAGDAKLLRASARRILYDVDDAVMYHNKKVGWYSRWRTTRRFHGTAAVLDHVVAGNQYLADVFAKEGCATTVLPTVVDPDRYQVKAHSADDALRLVWIGSRSTLPYLQECLPALEQAAERVAGLELITIADATVRSRKVSVEHIPWSAEGEAAALCRGCIGIAPTPTDPWTLGKCGFKILQYMAAGLPVIASPVGANAELVRDGETGFLPQRPEDWPEAIAALANDAALRRAWGWRDADWWKAIIRWSGPPACGRNCSKRKRACLLVRVW